MVGGKHFRTLISRPLVTLPSSIAHELLNQVFSLWRNIINGSDDEATSFVPFLLISKAVLRLIIIPSQLIYLEKLNCQLFVSKAVSKADENSEINGPI